MSADAPSPRDTFGRPMTDLRISVTDRCNFRCTFCMPASRSYRFLPKPQILTFEEMVRLAGLFIRLGVDKIRITGGEPLLRAEIEHLVAMLAALTGLGDLAMTTNAYLLPRNFCHFAPPLFPRRVAQIIPTPHAARAYLAGRTRPPGPRPATARSRLRWHSGLPRPEIATWAASRRCASWCRAD